VDRSALPTPDEYNTLRDERASVSPTPIEAGLLAIVARTLGRDDVGRDDNFFLLGGHSLLGTQVIAQVGDMFGVELSLQALFETPTIAELSVEVERLIVAKVRALSDEDARRLLT
jgi:acyl carrier protein